MYKAIVFDVDGTVVDTRFILDACRDAYHDVTGKQLSDETCDVMYGSPAAAAQHLMGLNDEEFAVYGKHFMSYLPKYLPKQKLFDGMRETMDHLVGLGHRRIGYLGEENTESLYHSLWNLLPEYGLDALLPDPNAKKSLFGPKNPSAANLADALEKLTNTCVICEDIDSHMQRYIVVVYWAK